MVKNNINFSIFIFTAVLFVNSNNGIAYYHQFPLFPNDTLYDCYITDIFSEKGENYIRINPVQFLWYEDALTEGIKDGAAECIIDPVTNDSAWFVPNDYYLNDDSSTVILKFRIDVIVKVTIYDEAKLNIITINELLNNPSYYKERYTRGKIDEINYSPYLITIVKGKVTKIQETYIP